MKKIAFVGCSHLAAFQQECQLDNNWTYQLYKKYPQHQYRNYSDGGKGPDYFKRALVDAKFWGADIVFMNRTHMGRWSFLADIYKEQDYSVDFKIVLQEKNWCELQLKSEEFSGHANYKKYPDKIHPNQQENKMHSWLQGNMNEIYEFFIEYHAATELRFNDDIRWYKAAPYLYNFENFFLIDWEKYDNSEEILTVTSNVCDIPVMEWFKQKYNAKNRENLLEEGIIVSRENHHLSRKGNTELLNEYILAVPEIVDALELK